MSKFFNRYSKPKDVSIDFTEPSLTDESFKQECDLGFIVENYVSKGLPLPTSTFNYADCTTVAQYEDAMQIVAEAKSNFEQLPSKDRDRFKTVEAYLEFISNPENLKESYEKNYIDPSSVDLSDIYPEQYSKTLNQVVSENVDVPIVSSSVDNPTTSLSTDETDK